MATIARLAQKLEADWARFSGLGDSMSKTIESAAKLSRIIDNMGGLSLKPASELTREEVNQVAADACEIMHELRPTPIDPLENEDSTDVLCRMLECEKQERQELQAVVADLRRRLAAFEAASRARVRTESDAGREGTASPERWEPPRGFVGRKTICSHQRFEKNGKNPPATSIDVWVKAAKNKGEIVEVVKAPDSGENHYPEDWILDYIANHWHPRQKRNTQT